MEDEFDALLYVGPPAQVTRAKLPAGLCADQAYMEMRLRRLTLMRTPPGMASPADTLRKYCADATKK